MSRAAANPIVAIGWVSGARGSCATPDANRAGDAAAAGQAMAMIEPRRYGMAAAAVAVAGGGY